MIREAICELVQLEHWKPTFYNLRHWMWPNALLNALPSCFFREPIKLGWGSWDSYWP